MKYITIGSFNLRNHYWDSKWDSGKHSKELANFIMQNNIDFLGTQEITKKYATNLQKELKNDYKIYGEYRFGNIPFINQFNEANAIITNHTITSSETKHLTTIPFIDHLTLWPRLITTVITKNHIIINTHIEYHIEYAQKYQLKVLYKHIENCVKNNQSPIIIGDFNMDLSKEYFVNFIKDLENLGIQYVNNSAATYATKEQILDHIFIPNNYEILKVEENY